MRVAEQAVEDGISNRWLAERLVPLLDGQLAGHDGGVALVSVLNNFEQIGGLLVGERLQAEVVDLTRCRNKSIYPDPAIIPTSRRSGANAEFDGGLRGRTGVGIITDFRGTPAACRVVGSARA